MAHHQIAVVLSNPPSETERKILVGALVRAGLDPVTPTTTIAGDAKPGKRAIKKQREAVERWLAELQPTVLCVAGAEALEALCGLRPLRAYRGKLVRGPIAAPVLVRWVVPTYEPATVRLTGFTYYPYLVKDLERAARAAAGTLRMVGV